MSKFKVGDKVRSSRPDWTNGLTGEVVFENGNESITDVCFGDDYKRQGWYHKDLPGCWCLEDDELELVTETTPETPKASSKFYVSVIRAYRTFDTLEEAEEYAKEQAEYHEGDIFGVFKGLKAFETVTETKEVTLA
jgi:hypothetical protein